MRRHCLTEDNRPWISLPLLGSGSPARSRQLDFFKRFVICATLRDPRLHFKPFFPPKGGIPGDSNYSSRSNFLKFFPCQMSLQSYLRSFCSGAVVFFTWLSPMDKSPSSLGDQHLSSNTSKLRPPVRPVTTIILLIHPGLPFPPFTTLPPLSSCR